MKDLYAEKYKTMMKEDMNKLKNTLRLSLEDYIIKLFILSKLVLIFHAITVQNPNDIFLQI